MENKNLSKTVLERLDTLCIELSMARDAFAQTLDSNEYPELKELLKGKHGQRAKFLSALREEYATLVDNGRIPGKGVHGKIYKDFSDEIAEKGLLSGDVLAAIIDREVQLVKKYRQLLEDGKLSGSAVALLQAQAEKMNADIQQFKLDLRTLHVTKPGGTVKKHKKSQIRAITD